MGKLDDDIDEAEVLKFEALLENSLGMHHMSLGAASRLEFLAETVFDFTTYDGEIAELFASKALVVCNAITSRKTLELINVPEEYQWYMIMVNMPFFANRLEWGSSIRGAWWHYEDQELKPECMWDKMEQVIRMVFTRPSWLAFLAACQRFSEKPEPEVVNN